MSETGMQVRGAIITIVVLLAGLWAAGSWIYHHMIAPRAPTAKVSVAPPPSPAPKKIDTDPFQPKKVSNYPIIQLLDKQLEKLSMSPSAVECRNIAPVLYKYYILVGDDRTGMETYNEISQRCLGK